MKSKFLLVINFLFISLLLAYFGLFLAKKVDLTTADLGRHLENGKIILSEGFSSKVLTTNFYSYTSTEEPFVNHHWLSGVVFYLIFLAGGFNLLSIFYVLLGCATLWLFFDVARKKFNLFISSAITIALMPLLASRAEVRPEMITYFFTGVFVYAAQRYTERETDGHGSRLIWFLPIIMLLWVNLHIGFVFGFLVLGAFCIEQYIITLSRIWREWPLLAAERGRFLGSNLSLALSKHWRGQIKSLTTSAFLCVIAGLLNPNFAKGFLYPLNIFKNYGYLIVENQSIKFLENLNFTTGQHFLLFKIVCLVLTASYIFALIVKRQKVSIALFLLCASTGFLAYNGIRHFPSFAFFALVAITHNIGLIINAYKSQADGLHYKIAQAVLIPVGLFIIIVSLSQGYQTLKARADFGIGLLPGVTASAEFFKEQNIKGPVFNDYDIGGYLIFETDQHGGERQKDTEKTIFVDNRPEGYTQEFFEKVYKPMQENEEEWQKQDEKYNFNAIFFSHRDYTPWAQTFLIHRVSDPNWAPVYVDGYNIIFLKRNEQNKSIIEKYEIPKSRFGITSN